MSAAIADFWLGGWGSGPTTYQQAAVGALTPTGTPARQPRGLRSGGLAPAGVLTASAIPAAAAGTGTTDPDCGWRFLFDGTGWQASLCADYLVAHNIAGPWTVHRTRTLLGAELCVGVGGPAVLHGMADSMGMAQSVHDAITTLTGV